MNNNHPLTIKRRTFKEVSTELTLSNKGNQIDLGINAPKANIIQKTKKRLANLETTLEILPYYKSFITVAAIMTSIVFIGLLLYLTANYYTNISDKFPFFFSQATQSWKMYDKEIIPLFIIGVAAILLISLRLNSSTQVFDRRLSTMINISLIIFNILGMIAFIEIFSLILIY